MHDLKPAHLQTTSRAKKTVMSQVSGVTLRSIAAYDGLSGEASHNKVHVSHDSTGASGQVQRILPNSLQTHPAREPSVRRLSNHETRLRIKLQRHRC